MKFRTFVAALVLILGAAVYFLGVRPRLRADARLARQEDERAYPPVNVAVARREKLAEVITLPAALQAFIDTPIYARTNGYIQKWLVDIGSRVKAGQTLAVIASPEVDQQLIQARAKLEQARSDLELARVTAARWEDLWTRNAVARQEVDEKQAAYAVAKANVSAARAGVDRFADLKRFEIVAAPFDGVVSARNIDVGTLIDAGSGAELFHLTQNDVIRVYIAVPQKYVRAIRPGVHVEVLVPQFPGWAFSGPIIRAAGALDPATRTLQTEVQIANPRGELFPGMSGQARLRIFSERPPLVLPSDAVVVRADGARVALIGEGDRIAIRKIVLGRDFGQQVEVVAGLDEGAIVVANPSDDLSDGMRVDVVHPAAGAAGTP